MCHLMKVLSHPATMNISHFTGEDTELRKKRWDGPLTKSQMCPVIPGGLTTDAMLQIREVTCP